MNLLYIHVSAGQCGCVTKSVGFRKKSMTDVQDTLPENASDATSDQALKNNLSGDHIKKHIKNWKADERRV